ncbi:MAG: CRISPR-associated nuclease/helicase Cas3 [Anaerolineales bacterium]|nr:CRISPR-associated nuclease/helicase Cas3 [Anaerolineales bacterium]
MSLYPYQQQVKELSLGGQSVILQAPTGAGKTRAALSPFIEAFFDFSAESFPRKCIYSVPLRTLANQFDAEYDELAASYERRHRHSMNVTIQTGEQPCDRKLEGDLIFTTIDQTLSNTLAIPYALSNRQANLNAGAVMGAYLVFDEFHLYDPSAALPTTLQLLSMLKDITPFVLMTATFSQAMLSRLADILNAEVVQVTEDDLGDITSQKDKVRYVHTVDDLLTAGRVLDEDATRSIAICNTVERAQNLYRELRSRAPANTEIKLLHSRFYQADREKKERWLQREFGKEKEAYTVERAILVATQVVEVGLDVTCEALHTEIAPANSVLQRAGRCARYQGETSHVYVYRVPEDDDGKPQYAPYHQGGQAELCDKTWIALTDRSGEVLGYTEELNVLNEVHLGADERLLDELQASRHAHRHLMETAIGQQERGLARELIRDVNAKTVLVHPHPNEMENPWTYDGFSLFTGSVYKMYRELDEWALDTGFEDWVIQRLQEDKLPSIDAPQEEVLYRWTEVLDSSLLEGALAVVINPKVAAYDEALGFRWLESSHHPWEEMKRQRAGCDQPPTYSDYQRETYAEHIYGLYRTYAEGYYDRVQRKVYRPLREEIAHVASRIERAWGVPADMIEQAARWIIAAHDVGKMGQAWQDWTHRWQHAIGVPIPNDYMAAHTDYVGSDPEHQALQKQLGRRPNHAAESAYAMIDVFWDAVGADKDDRSLYDAMMTAIVRHHTAGHAGSCSAFTAHDTAPAALREALKVVGLDEAPFDSVVWSFGANEELPQEMVSVRDERGLVFYFLLTRVLRLADQRSQAYEQ